MLSDKEVFVKMTSNRIKVQNKPCIYIGSHMAEIKLFIDITNLKYVHLP
jgi:hypothetical protein